MDQNTRGNWRGVVGEEGYNVISSGNSYPGYVTVDVVGKTDYQWSDNTSDDRALATPSGSSRVAGCWYSPTEFTVNLNFIDGGTHKLSMYFMDWDRVGRSQNVQVFDAATGVLLDTRMISNFADGVYLSWNVKGSIRVKLSRVSGLNAVLMVFLMLDTESFRPTSWRITVQPSPARSHSNRFNSDTSCAEYVLSTRRITFPC